MQPRPRSALPSRAERHQHQHQHEPTVVAGNSTASTKALQQARQGGHLKLRARGLQSLPEEVWDIATVPLANNSNWWETRETLETIDVSQNEIATLPDYFANKLDQLREWADAAYVNSNTEPRDRPLPCVPPGDKRSLYLPQCSADEAASKGRFFVARRLIDSRKPPVNWTRDA